MSAGIKANNDGSGAIQIGGSDYITISSAGAVAIPQTLAVTGTSTFTGATTLTGGVSGDFKMNSGYGSVATAYGCRAWVNFNGTGTVAIRASGNVTSITDGGVGIYTVNITTALPDVNYSTVITGGGQGTSGSTYSVTAGSQTTSAVTIQSRAVSTGNAVDENPFNVAIFR